ncbi:MAG: hypothetical protein B6I20_11435 [Bacteroidetes bacterium 4572_117]|nr:MAG: hypothetical protein B6I20_11435 [Bacteroidetes bacterium 4572_117]
MITAGKNIKQKNDQLQQLNIERLHKSIINPKPTILAQINQLRMVLTIDPAGYRKLKTGLPYVCCGNFNPPFRRGENFGSIINFIIDIDHLSEKKIDIKNLKTKLKSDPRVELMFTSPSNDGLKIFFRLSEKCYDAGKYSLFYKIFASAFSKQYNLEQVIDKVTSDVTRACFISYDKGAYFNPQPEPIKLSAFIDFENLIEVRETEKKLKEEQIELKPGNEKQLIEKNQLSTDILDEIKSKLNPKIKTKKDKIIYVPEELDEVIDKVTAQLNMHNIKTKEIINIHYAKKFIFQLDERIAEINLFFGKKGFTVLISPKTGTNAQLADVCYKLMCEIFY